VGLNLSLLAVFKYVPLLNEVSGLLSQGQGPTLLFNILVPLAISFFVFEFIHYVVDVYRGAKPVTNIIHFLLFPAFFPTQIAGPIKRFQDFVPQISRPRLLSGVHMDEGLYLVIRGLFKKLVVADSLASVVAPGFATGSEVSGMGAWTAAIAFGFQIYYDFSGYTDIGRGCATLLGFQVPENFFTPYASRDITQFWRRWHVTLSSWLRDYVYIPLGGGRRYQYRNLLATFVLGGLWHGAGLTFLVWGLMHGVALCTHKWIANRIPASGQLWGQPVVRVFSSLCLFAYVTLAWVFFRAPDFSQALAMTRAMLGSPKALLDFFSLVNTPETDPVGGQLAVRAALWALIVATVILPQLFGDAGEARLAESRHVGHLAPVRPRGWVVSAAAAALLAFATMILVPYPGDEANPVFIYFQF
jgi:alginate O-acetyltransferase complex protein AlgI